jgi:hypothetical protein
LGGPRDNNRRIRLFGEKPAHTVHVVNNFNFNFNYVLFYSVRVLVNGRVVV